MTNLDQPILAAMLLVACAVPALAGNDVHIHADAVQLTVALSNFSELPSSVLMSAVSEAERVLHDAGIHFTWIDCIGHPGSCREKEPSGVLIVRLLPRAPSFVPVHALGTTATSATGSMAMVYYDRVQSLRTYNVLLPHILGVVIAHELVHMLLPGASHSSTGLMRARLSQDDLRVGAECSISNNDAELLHAEAMRRIRGRAVLIRKVQPSAVAALRKLHL